jgi:maleylacetate reductase
LHHVAGWAWQIQTNGARAAIREKDGASVIPNQRTDSFVYNALPGRVVFGAGTRNSIADELARLQRSRAFVLSGPQQTTVADTILAALGTRGVGIFSGATMHTPVDVTDRALNAVQKANADALVSVGGGSTIGLGKAIALRTGLTHLVIPTTYAGSEMTPILGETAGGKKTTIRDLKVLPEVVVYDVELTFALPAALSAASGMNAIAHGVEALYARECNPIVSLMAIEGIGALVRALPVIVKTPEHKSARADALYGAWLCGSVLGSVGMALHHKLCHVLGGSFNLPHAATHTVVLPHATAYNAQAVPDTLAPLASLLGGERPGQGLYDLAKRIGAPTALKDIGMAQQDLDRAADIAMEQPYWNPKPLSRDAIRALLDDAWHGRRPRS